MPSTNVGIELKRSLRRLTICTVVLLAAVLGLGVYAYVDSGNQRDELRDEAKRGDARAARIVRQIQDQAQRTAVQSAQLTKAICALRAELKGRVEDSRDFLRRHPNGIPGISAHDVRMSIANTQQSVKALSGLKCGE